jgi:hypothetical protein
LEFKVCLLSRSSSRTAVSYQCRGGTHTAGAGELMLFEPGDHHVTQRVHGLATFDVIGLEAGELEQAATELGVRGTLHFRSPHLVPSKAAAGALDRLVAGAAAGADKLEIECRQARFVELLLQTCVETPAALRRRVDARFVPGRCNVRGDHLVEVRSLVAVRDGAIDVESNPTAAADLHRDLVVEL